MSYAAITQSAWSADESTRQYYQKLIGKVKASTLQRMNAQGKISSADTALGNQLERDPGFRSYLAGQYGLPNECGVSSEFARMLPHVIVAQFSVSNELRERSLDTVERHLRSAVQQAKLIPQCANLPLPAIAKSLAYDVLQPNAALSDIAITKFRDNPPSPSRPVSQAEQTAPQSNRQIESHNSPSPPSKRPTGDLKTCKQTAEGCIARF